MRIWTSRPGRTLVDFGQNLVGWVRFAVQGRGRARRSPSGTRRCSSTTSSASARCGRREATDRFILSGGDDEFEPTLTFHGFRYAEVDGWPGELTPTTSRRWWCISDLTRPDGIRMLGRALNQLHRTWSGARGATSSTCRPNARSVTNGWAGQATSPCSPRRRPSCSTSRASCASGSSIWPRSRRRRRHGAVRRSRHPQVQSTPAGVPDPGQHGDLERCRGVGAMGALAGLRRQRRLADAFPSMAAHVRRVEALLSPNGLWDTGFQFGDWLDPAAPPDEPCRGQGRQGRGGDRVPLPQRIGSSPRPAGSSAGRTTPANFAELAERTRAAFTEHYICRGRQDPQRLRHRVRAGDRFDLLDGRPRSRRASASPSWWLKRIPHRRPGSPAPRTSPGRSPRPDTSRRPTAPAGDGSALLALPGDDGRHHDLGALGLDAPRRHDQPRRDDELQPLRAGCGGGLDAPHDRRHRPRRAGLPAVRVAPRPGGGIDLGEAALDTPYGRVAVSWTATDRTASALESRSRTA